MTKFLAAIIITVFVQNCFAQTSGSLSSNATDVKLKVEHLQDNARISVVPIHAKEEFGTFVSADSDGFTFYDVDRKTDVHLRYEEVRKVKDGYGGYNSIRRTHTDHTKAIVVTLILSGLLVGVIVAAAASK